MSGCHLVGFCSSQRCTYALLFMLHVLTTQQQQEAQAQCVLSDKSIRTSVLTNLQLMGPCRHVSVLTESFNGTFRTSDIGGPLAGKTLADLLELMRAGTVYVNVRRWLAVWVQ